MILFVIDCPTPQRTSVLDRLQGELLDDVCVFYIWAGDPSRGWGEVPGRHRYTVLNGLRSWAALIRALLSPDLEAVCLFGYRRIARVCAAVLARLRGTPLVVRSDSSLQDEQARPKLRRLAKRAYLRLLLGQPEAWVIGSSNDAYWAQLGFRHRHLIPYVVPQLPGGADEAPALRETLGLRDRFVFAYVGRLTSDKGVPELLEAYETVCDVTPPGRTALLVAGPGPLEPDLRHYAGRRGDCHYLGAVPYRRLGAVYAAADVVVVPSRREPWGLVVNEALGFGTRVIATERVAAADDLISEETGSRCQAQDPQGLAKAMLAEVERGATRAPRLELCDVAAAMAARLRQLTASQR